MSKQFITTLTISIIVVALIAAAVALLATNFIPFWASFTSMFILVWFGMFLYRDWDIRRIQYADLIVKAKQEYIDERNIIQIDCPCGKTVISKEIFVNDLGGDNEYTCTACRSTYKVEITADPILITTPVNINMQSLQLFESLKSVTPVVEGTASAVTF